MSISSEREAVTAKVEDIKKKGRKKKDKDTVILDEEIEDDKNINEDKQT